MKLSLVMATYNGEKYLRDQLDSIYRQTVVPDEVIVVDDNSRDGTVAILEDYKKKYGLCYYVNSQNKGVNKNFEKAVSLAQGDYICICDQDDVWKSSKIEVSLNKIKEIENDQPACVSSQAIHVNEFLEPIQANRKYPKDCSWQEALFAFASQGCTLMFNKKMKELILPFSPFFIYDHFIGILSCFVGNRFCLGQPLMLYRHHSSNVIANKVHHYHCGLSEAMAIYQIMATKERFWLLKHIWNCHRTKFVNREKERIFKECMGFYDCDGSFQMLLHVLKSQYFTKKIKIYFALFMLYLCFNHKRKISPMKDPVTLNKVY